MKDNLVLSPKKTLNAHNKMKYFETHKGTKSVVIWEPVLVQLL